MHANRCTFIVVNPKATGSLITRLGPKAQPSTSMKFEPGTFWLWEWHAVSAVSLCYSLRLDGRLFDSGCQMIFLSEKCTVYKNTYTRITSKVYFEYYSFQYFKIISRFSRFNQSICCMFCKFWVSASTWHGLRTVIYSGWRG